MVIATGSRVPRDLPVPGRELDGVHFAMEYLYDRARCLDGNPPAAPITAAGKHVLVVGGGDTGADCVGHAHREGAASVTPDRAARRAAGARARTTSRRGRAGR